MSHRGLRSRPREGRVEGEPAGRSRRVKIGIAVIAVGAASFLAVAGFSGGAGPADPAVPAAGDRAAVDATVRQEVRDILWSIHGQWSAYAKRRAIGGSTPAILRHEDALREVLGDPENPLFWSAVTLAVQLRYTHLLPSMRAALDSVGDMARKRLVAEIDRIEPWSEDQLVGMLQGDSRGLVLGALQVFARWPARPLDEIVPLLFHEDGAIRAAALEALPPALSSDVGDRILIDLEFTPVYRSGEALSALGRAPLSREIEDVLYAQLERNTPHVHRVLDDLRQRAVPLTRPGPVYAIVQNAFLPVETRGRALWCLEETRTPAADVLEGLQLDHPVLDYLAARVLLRAGRPSGLARLLAVFDPRHDVGDQAARIQEARIGARQILARLASTSVYEDVSLWQEWSRGRQAVAIDRLPPVSVTLGGPEGP